MRQRDDLPLPDLLLGYGLIAGLAGAILAAGADNLSLAALGVLLFGVCAVAYLRRGLA